MNMNVDGVVFSAEKGTRLRDMLPQLKLAKAPVLAGVDGEVVGLDFCLETDADVHLIYPDSDEGIDILRHSASHLMAQAVLELFPGTQVGIGPAVENGFYYDFLRETPFTPQDLETIEKKMHELADRSLPPTGYIKHFKLLSVSGAYWKGDERGRQLQRIYGTVFFDEKQLADHLRLLEEAKERDHRKRGLELDLFSTCDALGGGRILCHPKGGPIRAALEQHWRERHWAGGYEILYTPHIGRANLWQTSGHLDFYKESMYSPMDIDEQD